LAVFVKFADQKNKREENVLNTYSANFRMYNPNPKSVFTHRMRRIKFLILTVLSVSYISGIRAQYFDATHRQSADEIEKFKNEKVKMVTISLSEAGNEVPYSVSFFDMSGRVTFIVNPKHHEHFTYDNKGRMDYWLDSANDGRRFEKFEYFFGYNPDNRINSYRTAATSSTFTAIGTDGIKEDVLKNGVLIEQHLYTYTPDGKLTIEFFKDTSGKQLYLHKFYYNKYGDLSSEIVVNPIKRCAGDSTTIINTYDSKARLIQKQKTITTFNCDLRVPNSPVIKKTISENIVYTYDNKGRTVTEALTSSNPMLNYRKEYQYSDENLITKELTFDSNGKQSKQLIYKYYYYIRKK
jgi:hypothetical protein